MQYKEIFETLIPLTEAFPVNIEVSPVENYENKTIYIIHFSSEGAIGRPVCQFSFFIEIELERLNTELAQLGHLRLNQDDIVTALSKHAHRALPALYPFAGEETDYMQLAKFFHQSRGRIAAKRFGF